LVNAVHELGDAEHAKRKRNQLDPVGGPTGRSVGMRISASLKVSRGS
jgi:hypothetical protein